jgi:hypothetical protein
MPVIVCPFAAAPTAPTAATVAVDAAVVDAPPPLAARALFNAKPLVFNTPTPRARPTAIDTGLAPPLAAVVAPLAPLAPVAAAVFFPLRFFFAFASDSANSAKYASRFLRKSSPIARARRRRRCVRSRRRASSSAVWRRASRCVRARSSAPV